MTDPCTRARVLVLATGLMLAALASAQGPMHGSAGRGGMPHGGAMTTGDEATFLAHMIPHHQEAIASAESLLARTERPELQALLRDIIESQTVQVDSMTEWVARWHPETPTDVDYAPMMRDLSDAPVADAERAFLEDMVMHHMMAVRDAHLFLSRGVVEHDAVATLARGIVDEQTRELAVMQALLADWFGAGWRGSMGMMAPGRSGEPQARTPGGHGHMGTRMHAPGHMGTRMHAPSHMGTRMHAPSHMGTRMHAPGHMGTRMHAPSHMGTRMHAPSHMGTRMHAPSHMGMHARNPGMSDRDPNGYLDEQAARALAEAFLAGAGEGGEVLGVSGPQVSYEVSVRSGEVEGVLIVDARTGAVRLVPNR
jgi:uncharacterized protein (DUF305 family)